MIKESELTYIPKGKRKFVASLLNRGSRVATHSRFNKGSNWKIPEFNDKVADVINRGLMGKGKYVK